MDSNNGLQGMMAHKKISNAIFLVLLILAGFLFVQMVSEIKAYKFIGSSVPATNTITVSGEGEAFAVADTATFSFSVVEEADTVSVAQEVATEKINAAMQVLDDAGIEDRDIKTVGYNVYPRYEYTREICTEYSCPPGERVLRGYEVSQTISVKVRDTETAGDLLAQIGAVEVSNVSGLTFEVADEDAPREEARKMAIDDAEAKAEQLARDLGVDLIRVVSFSEGGSAPMYRAYDMATMAVSEDTGLGGGSPQIPVGENRIVSNVSITYEIR